MLKQLNIVFRQSRPKRKYGTLALRLVTEYHSGDGTRLHRPIWRSKNLGSKGKGIYLIFSIRGLTVNVVAALTMDKRIYIGWDKISKSPPDLIFDGHVIDLLRKPWYVDRNRAVLD